MMLPRKVPLNIPARNKKLSIASLPSGPLYWQYTRIYCCPGLLERLSLEIIPKEESGPRKVGMSLDSFLFLPYEFLSRLCDFLNGWNFYTLRQVSHRSRYLIDEGPLGHVVTIAPFARLICNPLLCLKFKELRELNIEGKAIFITSNFYESLPKSLRKLKMNVSNTFRAFYRSYNPPAPLGPSFRDIGREKEFSPKNLIDIAKVFQGIDTLDLTSALGGVDLSLIISRLPSSVAHLTLKHTPSHLDKIWDVTIPEHLESLSFISGTFNLVASSSCNLRQLSMYPGRITFLDPRLATEIRQLRIVIRNKGELEVIRLMPHLEQLSLDCTMTTSDVNLLDGLLPLPASLKVLEISDMPCNETFLRGLPVGLTKLRCFMHPDVTDAICPILPRNLTSLALFRRWSERGSSTFSHPDHLLQLPPNLTYYDNSSHDLSVPGTAQYLPRKMRSSSYRIRVCPADVKDLPPNFEELTFLDDDTFSTETITQLPRHLTTFEYNGTEHFSDDHVALLPQQLTTLVLTKCTSITDSGIEHLPRTLTHLFLDRSGNITDQGFLNLPSGLLSLRLLGCDTLTNASAKALPRMITSLFIKRTPGWGDEAAVHLPRLLTHLELPYFVKLTDDGFKRLPYLLHTLVLTRSRLLTPRIFQLIDSTCGPKKHDLDHDTVAQQMKDGMESKKEAESVLLWDLSQLNLKNNFNFNGFRAPKGLGFFCRSCRHSRRSRNSRR